MLVLCVLERIRFFSFLVAALVIFDSLVIPNTNWIQLTRDTIIHMLADVKKHTKSLLEHHGKIHPFYPISRDQKSTLYTVHTRNYVLCVSVYFIIFFITSIIS